VQLRRRFDLIPNLVEVVKGASHHEQQITKNLSLLFEKYIQINSSSERLLINEELSKLLNSFYKEIEKNPNIKANENFLLLQKELAEIEEDISFARQFYNDAVTIYNNAIMSFPNNTVARKYHFEKEKLFDIAKDASKAPQIRITPKQPNEIKCVTCGAILEDGIRHCKYCGTTF
jgi:LemA protein